ncbi:MAG: TylF/MycF family methyltransferase [Pseudomonadota bacterium]|nr:TylF/MycF family methyltransferase [Pseudomonadota bacterium]
MQSAYGDLDPAFAAIHNLCRPATMTSVERMYALYKAVEYLVAADIPGDFAECGVWRGGSVMVMAATLVVQGRTDRRIFLYDTFEGMSPPTVSDLDLAGRPAATLLGAEPRTPDSLVWSYAPLETVLANLRSVRYPMKQFQIVQGKVEKTIPRTLPGQLALLRLDTDWYESTRHEMEHLYPLLVPGGVLIVDDYGHWRGSRQAIDEYFAGPGRKMLLNRIDYTGRIGVKI